jgi:hypothetical protein
MGLIFKKSQLSNGSRWLSALNVKKLALPEFYKFHVDRAPLISDIKLNVHTGTAIKRYYLYAGL